MKAKSTGAKKRSKPPRASAVASAYPTPTDPSEEWILRLYVAGQTPKSLAAFANLKRICEELLAGRYQIQVIDLTQSPQLASNDQIVALPTLVRKLPEPIKRIIGNLSNRERVLVGMDLLPASLAKRP